MPRKKRPRPVATSDYNVGSQQVTSCELVTVRGATGIDVPISTICRRSNGRWAYKSPTGRVTLIGQFKGRSAAKRAAIKSYATWLGTSRKRPRGY